MKSLIEEFESKLMTFKVETFEITKKREPATLTKHKQNRKKRDDNKEN